MGVHPFRCYFCNEHEIQEEMFYDEHGKLRCCDIEACRSRMLKSKSAKTKSKSSRMRGLKRPRRAKRYRR